MKSPSRYIRRLDKSIEVYRRRVFRSRASRSYTEEAYDSILVKDHRNDVWEGQFSVSRTTARDLQYYRERKEKKRRERERESRDSYPREGARSPMAEGRRESAVNG